jgi:hypothetical protein
MKKEALEKRLQLVDAEMNQTMANYNALLGVKNELNHWLKVMELEAAEEAKKCEAVCDVVPEAIEERKEESGCDMCAEEAASE